MSVPAARETREARRGARQAACDRTDRGRRPVRSDAPGKADDVVAATRGDEPARPREHAKTRAHHAACDGATPAAGLMARRLRTSPRSATRALGAFAKWQKEISPHSHD
jgi:hypothetical protein